MFVHKRSVARGDGGGGRALPLNLRSMFALCGLLLLVPQLASSSILSKLSEDPDLSQVSAAPAKAIKLNEYTSV